MSDSYDGELLVILRSKDGVEFTLPKSAASLSELVKDAIPDDEDDDDDNDNAFLTTPIVDVLRVHSDSLQEVVNFLKHYNTVEAMIEIPTPLNGSSVSEVMTQEWYSQFILTKAREQILDLVAASNYMGIKPLMDLSCLRMTFELTGKTAEEIRDILNLPHMTPDEETRARQEHRWIFEDN
jgi:S-phase kinase-associated protein 1